MEVGNGRLWGIEGQLEGAIMMAGGHGSCEDQPMDEGKILNLLMADHKTIRSLDMPEREILGIDTCDEKDRLAPRKLVKD